MSRHLSAEVIATSGLSFLDLFTTLCAGEKANLIKDANGQLITPSDQPVRYAAAMLRLRREHGGDAWVKRFFSELATCPRVKANTRAGALSQGWSWLLCASVAAQKDLSPVFCGEWKLPLAPDTRMALAKIDWRKTGLTVSEIQQAVIPKWQEVGP